MKLNQAISQRLTELLNEKKMTQYRAVHEKRRTNRHFDNLPAAYAHCFDIPSWVETLFSEFFPEIIGL